MRKILFVSHTANFSKFNRPFMRWFLEQGWQVDYASDKNEKIMDCDNSYEISFKRNPFSPKNIKAYFQLKELIRTEGYNIIHCHTPVGGVIARLAARKYKKNGVKVIYTAHGFHFYKGAPFVNWLLYFSVEKIMAKYTDCLVVLNKEDYDNARRFRFKAESIKRIDGVGVDVARFRAQIGKKSEIRELYEYGQNEFILLCVAEINRNKDQEFLIENMLFLKEKIPNVKLVIAGVGPEMETCKKKVDELGLTTYVKFLGYRQDVDKLIGLADVLVSASKREGFPINIAEGMAGGLAIVCTDNRGHRAMVDNSINGYIYRINDAVAYCDEIIKIASNKATRERISKQNISDAQRFEVSLAVKNMSEIYKKYM